MPFLTMREAAKALGVNHQNLAWYYHHGKLTGQDIKVAILVDPEVARGELEKAGFFERRELRRSRKRAKAEK